MDNQTCACLQDAKNMTLTVTAIAIVLAEGKSEDEINLMANIFNGIGAQLDILASFHCGAGFNGETSSGPNR